MYVFFFRKLPIQEFHLSRVMQEIGLTNEQVKFFCEKSAEHYIVSSCDIFHLNSRSISSDFNMFI